jgi:hypothetical protein
MAHSGGCHCGKVRFKADIDLSTPVIECNCSHCLRKGFLFSFAPREAMTLEQGDDALIEYRFNTHRIAHQFCSTCGVEAFAWGEGRDGSPTVAINVRCLDRVDLDALTRQPWDGANH